MKKTNSYSFCLGILFIVGASIYAINSFADNRGASSNNTTQKNKPKITETKNSKPAEKVQVFLFHSTQRCATCIAIGRLVSGTVSEFFQSELRDGKIEFREINIDLPENKELAQKFKATGSALYLNAITDGADNISQDTKVWQLTSNETQFKSYLKGKINNYFGK